MSAESTAAAVVAGATVRPDLHAELLDAGKACILVLCEMVITETEVGNLHNIPDNLLGLYGMSAPLIAAVAREQGGEYSGQDADRLLSAIPRAMRKLSKDPTPQGAAVCESIRRALREYHGLAVDAAANALVPA